MEFEIEIHKVIISVLFNNVRLQHSRYICSWIHDLRLDSEKYEVQTSLIENFVIASSSLVITCSSGKVHIQHMDTPTSNLSLPNFFFIILC